MTAFEEGVNARMMGKTIFENPYHMPSETGKWCDWNDGWIEADKGDDRENGRGGYDEM